MGCGIRFRNVLAVIMVGSLLLACVASASAAVRCVKWDAAGANNGTSWTDAYTELQSALAVALPGDEIWVAAGTYRPALAGGSRSNRFLLRYSVAIYGGFGGTEVNRDQRIIGPNETILSGDLNSDDGANFSNRTDNSFCVLITYDNGAGATLDGLTISGGHNDAPGGQGGGLWQQDGQLTVSNCRFRENYARSSGGAMSVGGSVTVADSSFIANDVDGGGSVVQTAGAGGSLTFSRCVFADNSAGGVKAYQSASFQLTDCTFVRNSTGLAVFADDVAATTLTRCVMTGNTAGALASSGTFGTPCMRITNCTFTANTALSGGAVQVYGIGDVFLTNCLINHNSASGAWGSGGGALHHAGNGLVVLTNCTVVRNEVPKNMIRSYGGGISFSGSGAVGIRNCVVWDNAARLGSQISIDTLSESGSGDGGPLSVSATDIQGGQDALHVAAGGSARLNWDAGNLDSDPLFADPLGADLIVGTDDDDLRLLGGSPCLDSGDNGALVELPPTDLSGAPRLLNGTLDLGAHEGPRQGLAIRGAPVAVPENGTAFFSIALGVDPRGPVDVTVSPASGDPDIRLVSASVFHFNSSNYWIPQAVWLSAAHDTDSASGSAAYRVSAPGLVSRDVTAFEWDDDHLRLFVDADAPGANNGASWSNAYRDLQSALQAANPGDEIWVAAATYRPAPPGGARELTFQLKDGVAIYGGFAGAETAREQRNALVNETILSGDLSADDGTGFVNNGENSYHVVEARVGVSTTAILDGFTITGGHADDPSQGLERNYHCGAGLYVAYSSPTVRSCRFTANRAEESGGGVYCEGEGSPEFTACRFEANACQYGGGLHAWMGAPRLSSCVFTQNSATRLGGGMFYAETMGLAFNCAFLGNTASEGGGACSSTYDRSLFANCIWCANAGLSFGGGVSVRYASPEFVNCALAANKAGDSGGGVRSENAQPIISNSILWGNQDGRTGGSSSQISVKNGTPMVRYCCVEGGWAAPESTGIVVGDPLFVREPFDGGDGWGVGDDDFGDLRLAEGSPCIDAASASLLPSDTLDLDLDGDRTEPAPVDLGGNARISGAGLDMGAYEGSNQAILTLLSGAPSRRMTIPEGQAVALGVRLARDPGRSVAVEIRYYAGDRDIRVQTPMPLVFTSSNYNTLQMVSLVADEDSDYVGGRAYLRINAENVGWSWLTVDEQDNDVQEVVFVDAQASGQQNGTSWADAYADLQMALTAARNAPNIREVWVARGTYRPAAAGGDRTATFRPRSGLAVYGGFAGSETQITQRDPAGNRTVLSGDLNANDNPAWDGRSYDPTRSDNSYHVVTASDVDATGLLDGVTITAGNAADLAPHDRGGALYASRSTLTLRDCVFEHNAASEGGAIYIESAGPTCDRCVFTSNCASRQGWGGALSVAGSGNPVLRVCTFERNWSSQAGAAAVLQDVCRLTISQCRFLQNETAETSGIVYALSSDCRIAIDESEFEANVGSAVWASGAIRNSRFRGNRAFEAAAVRAGPDIDIAGCVFEDNVGDIGPGAVLGYGMLRVRESVFRTNRSMRGGGAMGVYAPQATIDDCIFRGNVAGAPGGALDVTGTNTGLAIKRCVFEGNSAVGEGGAVSCHGSQIELTDCVFSGNSTPDRGGAISVEGFSGKGTASVKNCTLSGNWAGYGGGSAILGADATIEVVDSILWHNQPVAPYGEYAFFRLGGQVRLDGAALCTFAYCDVSGGPGCVLSGDGARVSWNEGNMDTSPRLAPDGHLCRNSPCVEAGDPDFVPSPDASTDTDGESRVIGARVDIGADEFIDTDGDRLPDWWEQTYFGSAIAADPAVDTDSDGLTNVQEYEEYSSNPIAPPWYVNAANGSDSNSGRSPASPKQTIQAALTLAQDGDTVLVSPGTYRGNLNYHTASVVVRAVGGPSLTSIECTGTGRAVAPDSIKGAFAVLEGFAITGGSADLGGGFRTDNSRLMFKDCLLVGNNATTDGGGLYSDLGAPTIDGLTIQANTAPSDKANAGVISASSVNLQGPLALQAGRLDLKSSWFDGLGHLDLADGTLLKVTGTAGASPSVMRSNITGTGDIQIDVGQELRVENGAIVDLSGQTIVGSCQGGCPEPGASSWGTITVDGALVVQDATVRNANVNVRLAEFGGAVGIVNNDIRLLETSTGYGGQFFVTGHGAIECNRITSEGDRYLDLAPDPKVPPEERPVVCNNRIKVIIKEGIAGDQGTLLELRTQDYDHSIGDGKSGAYQVASSPGYADTWVLEELEVLAGAKLNLTNRQGFVFQAPDIQTAEVVYVKTLKLHANAVLNTGLQRLYYQRLVNESGDVMERPSDPAQSLPNGSWIKDEPLLGFSLARVGMDDSGEFDVRIYKRNRDASDAQPENPPYKEGLVVRVDDPAWGGVMEMKTKAADRECASSVAAKGAFARAGDEDIVIAFEYLFQENPAAEIIVKLSDKPDVGERSFEVARVRVPPAGVAGSIGSDRFAVFYAQFPRVQPGVYELNFTRGTYVELELVASRDGQNNPVPSAVWIDNLDPQVICRFECASFDGVPGITSADFLVLLGEYGRTLPSDDVKSCLDSRLARDHYVDVGDLLGWDTLAEGALDSCGVGTPLQAARAATPDVSLAGMTVPTNTFLVAGKPNGPGQQADAIYSVSVTGGSVGASLAPVGGSGSRANGRLIKDNRGVIYQIHGTHGLIRLRDGQVMIPPPPEPLPTFDGKTVYVGVKNLGGGEFAGVPIADAVVRTVAAETYVYVVPVLVSVPNDTPPHSYKAAAKLRITGPGQYTVEQLYGTDPYHDRQVTTSPPEASPYNAQGLRGIEVDRSGQYVFVLSAFGLNENDWLLIYDEATAAKQEVLLTGLSADLKGPTAMLASSTADKLYLTSSANAPSEGAELYRLTFNPAGPGVSLDGKVQIVDVRQVTAICEKPGDGALYVTGFQAPEIPEDLSTEDPLYRAYFSNDSPIFTTARWGQIPAGANWTVSPPQSIPSQAMNGADLALPLSAVFVERAGVDFDGDADVDLADFLAFQDCFNGPNRAPKNAGCGNADFDADADVDLADFLNGFQRCFNGPNRPPKCP